MRPFAILGCAILSGVLLALSMPPVGWSILGWVSLIPLLASVQGTRWSYGFPAGLISAVAAAFLLAIGVMPIPHRTNGDPNWIYGGFLLFGVLLAFMSRIVAETKVLRYRHVALYAAYAVCLEALLMFILPVHLALSQYRLPAAMAIASYAGIWGVSYLVWFTQLLIVKTLRMPRGAVAKSAGLIAAIALVCLFLRPPSPVPGGPRVAVLQTDDQNLGIFADLDARVAKQGARLVVWPELSALSEAHVGDTSGLKALSLVPGEPAFVTTFEDAAKPKPHNAAALFWRGAESKRYFKRMPFASEATIHQAGDFPVVANCGFPVGLNICFDSCHPSVLRDTVLLTPIDLIALPTEDPVSENGVVQALHSSYTTFRAAELGVPIARSDISAYSMIVGPNGDILGELTTDKGVLVRTLPKPRGTFYRSLGDWFLYLCALATLGSMVGALRIHLKKRTAEARREA